MKLASITLPSPSPWNISRGDKLREAHTVIVTTLFDWCRGFTRVNVTGGWINTNGDNIFEEGMRYEFTSPNTKTARDELIALAYRIKTISDEEAIFIVHANGNTEIVR